jgi:cytosine/uracil/thiamine/allantoin permease
MRSRSFLNETLNSDNINVEFEEEDDIEQRISFKNFEFIDDIDNSKFYNEDLAPVPLEKRTWTTYNFAALWISMAH